MLGIYSLIWTICHKLMWFYRNAISFHIIFVVTHGEIFSHHTLDSQQNGAAVDVYTLRVQRFAAGANVTWLTYATDWWAVIGPVIHGESKSQATRSSSGYVGLLHTLSTIDTQRVKTRGASCIGGFGQTDGRRKFELGISQSRDAAYNRCASYIRGKMVMCIIPPNFRPIPKTI